jgi:hypothetical protein
VRRRRPHLEGLAPSDPARSMVGRALSVAGRSRAKLDECVAAYRKGGVPALAKLDEHVAGLVEVEVRYGGSVRLEVRREKMETVDG